jgi:hypothetical protein
MVPTPVVLGVGQGTGVHVDTKNGKVLVGVTLPWKPATHVQPLPTLGPKLLTGQATFSQDAFEKNGAVAVGVKVPLKPGKQVQPVGTLRPPVVSGQLTAGLR